MQDMKECIAYNMSKAKDLILDTYEKMKIALTSYPDDEEMLKVDEECEKMKLFLNIIEDSDGVGVNVDAVEVNEECEKDIHLDNVEEYFNNEECEKEDVNNEDIIQGDYVYEKEIHNEDIIQGVDECDKEIDNEDNIQGVDECDKEIDNNQYLYEGNTVEGVYNLKKVSKEAIVIPSGFYNPSNIIQPKKRMQKTPWEENKNLAIVVFDDPGLYSTQESSDYGSSRELRELICSEEGRTRYV